MRRGALMVSIVVVAGCASGGGSASAPASQTMRVVGPSSTEAIALSGGPETSTSRTLPYSVEKIWRALPSVLDSLGIPIETMDPAKRVIGNTGFKTHARLKNVPLSRYLDCGNSTGIGPNADNYEVHMVFLASVQPAEGTSSRVALTFEAAAKPVNFAQDYSQCGSKAYLETRVFELLAGKLAS